MAAKLAANQWRPHICLRAGYWRVYWWRKEPRVWPMPTNDCIPFMVRASERAHKAHHFVSRLNAQRKA